MAVMMSTLQDGLLISRLPINCRVMSVCVCGVMSVWSDECECVCGGEDGGGRYTRAQRAYDSE